MIAASDDDKRLSTLDEIANHEAKRAANQATRSVQIGTKIEWDEM